MNTTTAPPSAPESDDCLWTQADIAAYFQVVTKTVQNWREERHKTRFPESLPLPGRLLRWKPDDVKAWSEGEYSAPAAEPVKLRQRHRKTVRVT